MKRCPDCRRDYYDDSLIFCLDDGAALLDGPANHLSEPPASRGVSLADEPSTAILSPASEAETRHQIGTTDQTAILPSEAEAEPQSYLGDLSEKHSLSANRAAKPLAALVVAALVLAGGFLGYKYLSPTKQIDSIAVMPFVNESGNADIEYLSDGMTETLINSLSQLPNTKVMSRSSVFRYKGTETDAKKIGMELNVGAIVTGRVKQIGDQLIIIVSLDDAQDNHHIWGEQYLRKQSDLVSLQSEIARDVSSKLKSKLSGAEVAAVEKSYTENPEAYQLYLKGLHHWNKRTGDDIKQAISFFQQAIEKDPAYAKAYGGIAMAYEVLLSNTAMAPQEYQETKLKAKAAAAKALEIDSNLAEAHAVLAERKAGDWDFTGGELDYKRAIELNPNFATAHQWYSELLSRLGRYDEALAEIKRAYELDPFSRAIKQNLGLRLLEMHRNDEAILQFKKLNETDPDYPMAYVFLSSAYTEKGMFEESIEPGCKAEVLLEIETEQSCKQKTEELRQALKQGGARGFWQKTLEYNIKSYERGIGTAVVVAGTYSRLGDKERAFEWLEKAFTKHDQDLSYLKVDYAFDSVKDDPRFKDLLRRIGLPE